MKRVAISLSSVAEYENLIWAVHRAIQGKRTRPVVQRFLHGFGRNLGELHTDILAEELPYGRFRRFMICDPKPRVIHAACFEDRIFHHALMRFIDPVLERASTRTSYACRLGMGSHAAVQQVQRHLRRFPWYVKIDVRHYFDAIDHGRLLAQLQRRFKGLLLLAQLRRIVDSYQTTPGKGLPIGALSSQHFANYYLDGLDRYLLETLKVCAQIRYMDDTLWWCKSRAQAHETLEQVTRFLQAERLLRIKPDSQINRSTHGITFCGFRITLGRLLLSSRRRRRYRQLRQRWERLYRQGKIDSYELQRAYDAVHAITLPADSLVWRQNNLQRHPPLEI